MSPTAIPVEDIVFACENLCELLEIENEALANHDQETIRALAENKAALARLYEQVVLPMAENPSLVDGLDPDDKDMLMALGLRLKELVEINARRLKAEMESCQRLMDAMVNAVKTTQGNTVTYGRKGAFGTGAAGPEANSLAFNKTL